MGKFKLWNEQRKLKTTTSPLFVTEISKFEPRTVLLQFILIAFAFLPLHNGRFAADAVDLILLHTGDCRGLISANSRRNKCNEWLILHGYYCAEKSLASNLQNVINSGDCHEVLITKPKKKLSCKTDLCQCSKLHSKRHQIKTPLKVFIFWRFLLPAKIVFCSACNWFSHIAFQSWS